MVWCGEGLGWCKQNPQAFKEHNREDSQIQMARYKPWSGFGPLRRSRALLVYHSLDMKRDGEPSSLRQRETESPAKINK